MHKHAKEGTNRAIKILLDQKAWKNHRLREKFLKEMVRMGADVFIFNKERARRSPGGLDELMHIKTIVRQCNQRCLSLVSTANFTLVGRQGIDHDLWEPCSFERSNEWRVVFDSIIAQSTKLDAKSFPSENVIKDYGAELLRLVANRNRIGRA